MDGAELVRSRFIHVDVHVVACAEERVAPGREYGLENDVSARV